MTIFEENDKRLLGERIRQAIKESEFTQKQVAAKLNITPNSLSNYSNGKRVPDALLAARFAQLCQVNINWLLTGVGTMFLEAEGSIKEGIDGWKAEEIEQLRKDLQELQKENRELRELLITLSRSTASQDDKIKRLQAEVERIKATVGQ